MSEGRMLRRRTLLTSGALGASAIGLGLSGGGGTQISDADPAQTLAHQNNVLLECVHSEARNRDVDLVTMYPKGMAHQNLPVCLMLHGRFGDAVKSADGLPTWLSNAVARREVPPFAFLAVDGGGNSYWHNDDGDDPMWMLIDEVPRWLGERGLGGPDGQPFAVSGISMGGFGALVYARRRREHGIPLESASIVSPALLTSWKEMRKRGAFNNAYDWAAIDPIRHVDALADLPLGVWCGTGDAFIKGTRRFVRKARPDVVSTSPGGHNTRYFRKALPQVVNFVGRHMNTAPSAVT